MSCCENCGSYAINDDPQKALCDRCWRDARIVELEAELERLRDFFCLPPREDAQEQ